MDEWIDAAIALTAAGIFKDYDMEHPIALTFEAAIQLINTNADLIY